MRYEEREEYLHFLCILQCGWQMKGLGTSSTLAFGSVLASAEAVSSLGHLLPSDVKGTVRLSMTRLSIEKAWARDSKIGRC